MEKAFTTIEEHFSSIKDPRVQLKTLHKLIDIITITICGTICGASGWTEIEKYGNAKYDWLKNFLELPNGIPSHDTFGNVFSVLSIEEFEQCFLSWIQAVFKKTDGQVIAIDGKTLRGSHDKSSNKAAIHMVSAWASKNKITLGQVKTEDKSNEITAIPELIKLLELSGCIVTIDAMGAQKKIAKQIKDKDGDYVLALKGNQGNLHKNVTLFFEDAIKNDFKGIPFDYHQEVNGDHGRVEVREYWTVGEIDWLQGKEDWEGIKIIGMVKSERHVGDEVSKDYRYYIASIDNDAKKFGEAVRDHWGIENSVHWCLDVAFREDECRIRKGNADANLSIVRHIALNLLKKEKTLKCGIEAKRKTAGWDNGYLQKVLQS